MAAYNHFYELPVYKARRHFRKEVSKGVKMFFLKEERFLLTAQLTDAVRSITANIAEDFSRFHQQEKIQFCRQSSGSFAETMEHLRTAYDEAYISNEILKEFNKQYQQCLKELNTFIKYLKTAKKTNNQ